MEDLINEIEKISQSTQATQDIFTPSQKQTQPHKPIPVTWGRLCPATKSIFGPVGKELINFLVKVNYENS